MPQRDFKGPRLLESRSLTSTLLQFQAGLNADASLLDLLDLEALQTRSAAISTEAHKTLSVIWA